MKVRSIQSNEVQWFAQSSSSSESWEKPLETLLDQGKTCLSWCFALEQEGVCSGRIVYGLLDQKLVIFHLWMHEFDSFGFDLLIQHSTHKMSENGFLKVELHLYSDKSNFSQYAQSLQANGFAITQKKTSLINKDPRPSSSRNRLLYRSCMEVGDDAFIEAIRQVTRDTLDQDDLDSVLEYGEEKAARHYFAILEELDNRKDWWKLGFTDQNQLVGLVVPQKPGESTGVINYIGVVPEHRGHGYGKDLLEEGIRVLRENNVSEIIADIDAANFPMENALLAQGFEPDASLLVMKKDLEGAPESLS